MNPNQRYVCTCGHDEYRHAWTKNFPRVFHALVTWSDHMPRDWCEERDCPCVKFTLREKVPW